MFPTLSRNLRPVHSVVGIRNHPVDRVAVEALDEFVLYVILYVY